MREVVNTVVNESILLEINEISESFFTCPIDLKLTTLRRTNANILIGYLMATEG